MFIGVPFRDFAETKSFRGECFKQSGVNTCDWRYRPHTKAGGSNGQTSDQAWNVGSISYGAEHCAFAHPGPCGWRWWRWWRSFFRYGSGPFLSAFVLPAFVLPEAVGHQSHPEGQEDQQAVQHDDPAFSQGYRAAYATIYDRNDYSAAIEQLKALDHDDHPNVANLIGYSYRKLGDYKVSQVWYERALKADPNHVLTWNYYGLWQIEQGNREQAEYHLSRIAAICGTDCAEYRSLAEALEKPAGTALAY
jgi:hypothetical protein